ncbi:5'-methylthioadenosine/S-adenosylhomocysteine nucleosidase [Spiroplasma corruscae]|nr:5'-methylthioadenosine/S-adenosylhomocysteine nucleosidase [Spiroplasma corruscae]
MIINKYNYAFIFAMYDEAKDTIEYLGFEKIMGLFDIYKKDNYYIVISGIGLVNASTCLTYMDTKFDISYFINVGTACSLSHSFKQLDFFIVEEAFLGNVDVTGFGYSFGQVPKMPKSYLSNDLFNKELINFKKVKILSSDVFINSKEKVENIIYKVSKDIDLVDMECAAIFQSAYILKKSVISIKIISDVVGTNSNENDFAKVMVQCSSKIKNLIKLIIK